MKYQSARLWKVSRRKHQHWLVAIVLISLLWASPHLGHGDDKTAAVDFDRQIAPLLASRCLDCHNKTEHKGGLDLSQSKTALAGGDSGKVLSPGDLSESLLWDYVSSDEMPPKNPLTAAEKALLKKWIERGAKWGSDPINPFRFTTVHRAGYDWWCLQPLTNPKPPQVKAGDWPRGEIDRFVLAQLEERDLAPSGEADRRTLIRRLSFDLLGLPPTPQQVREFVADQSPHAYESLVERMLSSPHYGERWGRHWLDVVRYGESQGFERDKLRDHFWHYRDWVVRALNSDMPYNEFARLQLAGDILRPGDQAAIAATGFLVAGAYDEVGQSQQSAAMRAVVRQDELEDIISVVGQTFLGLTVNCARCHDHKFDPVSQVEYYQLASALGGVRHGERDFQPQAFQPELAGRVRELDGAIASLKRERDELSSPIRERILARRKENRDQYVPPSPIAEWNFNGNLRDSIGELHGEGFGGATLHEGRLVLDGKDSYVATPPLDVSLTEKTLEAWVSLADLSQRGGGVVSLQTLDGTTFDAIVFGERKSQHWMSGSNRFLRTSDFQGVAETSADQQLIHIAIVYRADGTIFGYRNGRQYGKPYRKERPQRFTSGNSQILFGLRHSPAGGNRFLAGTIDRVRLYDRALPSGVVAASAGVEYLDVSESEILAEADDETRARLQNVGFEIINLTQQRRRYRHKKIYANVPQPAEVAHVLIRGNTTQPAAAVAARGIAAVSGDSPDFGLPADAPEADRRRKLADWITSPQNPLFARVIVNRIWHYHFGRGLVDTPNDFGFNGGRPSHPELIDWLAARLIADGWRLKKLHRLIVTSATYRQASQFRRSAARADGENRFYWRKSPTRLEAESVRDAVLSVAGQLNPQIGGPGYRDFDTFVRNTQFYNMRDPQGDSFTRRSLYRTWVRSGRNRFLDVFDCPDPSTKTPARAVTTTPLQALAMMNNSFVLRMSQRLAERLVAENGAMPEAQIRGAYELAYSRPASDTDVEVGLRFIKQYGLAAYCRVLFNSNEFLYVD